MWRERARGFWGEDLVILCCRIRLTSLKDPRWKKICGIKGVLGHWIMTGSCYPPLYAFGDKVAYMGKPC